MLKTIRIQRFKSLEDVEVTLGRMTLLVGPNNSGKSSILQAIQFAVSLAQSLALDARARWSAGTLSGTLSAEQIVYTPLRDVQALAKGGSLKQDRSQGISITFTNDDGQEASVSASRGKNKNIAVTVSGRALGSRLQSLDNPYSVIAPGLAGIPAFEEYRSPGLVRRAAARGDANSVLRNILWALKSDTRAWSDFQARLSLIFPDVALDVVFDNASDEHIMVQVTREGVSLPLDSSGTGILQATQVLAYIGLYKPRVLILDEPDSHLHPDNQRKLVRLLGEVAEEEDIQVIYSTHSRHLLDEALRNDAVIHWVSSGQIQAGEVDVVQALLGLGALDAGDKLRNGATPYLVLTEDSDLRYLRAILPANGLDLKDCQLWSYSSCTSLPAAKALARFVKENASGTEVIVHVDRDYKTDEQVAELVVHLEAEGLRAFITEGVDIESHFLTPSHIALVFPELSEEEREALLDDATTECEAASVSSMINARTTEAFRNRKDGQSQPNVGNIATKATVDYHTYPQRFRHGKKVLRRLRALAQERYGINREIAAPTSALIHASLARDDG